VSKPNGKILITGGDGLIGSALIWALNERGRDDIIVTGLLGAGEKWKNLVALRFEDYLEADRLLECLDSPRLADVSHIFHLGACSDTTEKDCRYLIENNGDLDTAIKYLDMSIGIQSNWSNNWWRAQGLAKKGRTADAIAAGERALELGKGNATFETVFKTDVQKTIDGWKKGKA